MATKIKSGIRYTTGDNGSANGVEYANKIVTINDSDYFLLDAHMLDWNKSLLKHLNPSSEYLVDTRREAVEEFFELNKAESEAKGGHYPYYVDDDKTHPLNRYRYYGNETPIYKSNGSLDSRPFWYYDNTEKQSTVHDSAELLDIIDFLAALANKAIKEVDILKHQMDKDKAMLVLDEDDIEEMGGKVDGNGDVISTPIKFILKPNQTDNNYVTDKETKKFYDEIERRHVGFALYVYTVNGIPITDPYLLYDDMENPNFRDTCGLVWSATNATLVTNTKPTVELSVGPKSSSETGVFRIEFDVTGWISGLQDANSFSTPSTIHLTKRNIFKSFKSVSGDTINLSPYPENTFRYENKDFISLTFLCHTKTTENHLQSDNRKVTINIEKVKNTFDHVFICGEEYIYLDENFFKGYENNVILKPYISAPDKEFSTKSYNLVYLIRRSIIPESLENLSAQTFIRNAGLLDSLIVANNEYFDETIFNIKGLNTTVNKDVTIEVYPKFYGDKTLTNAGKLNERHILPGSYEYKDTVDGAKHIGATQDAITKKWFYNETTLYNDDTCMAPLYCFDYPLSMYNYNGLDFYTLPSNKYTSNEVNVANEYVTKIIDGQERPGFKFSFRINATTTHIQNIKIHNNRVKTNSNYISDNVKPVFIDVIFGTTAAKFVSANFLKIRFYLTTASEVYFVDRTKNFAFDEKFNTDAALSSQWSNPTNINVNLSAFYGLSDNPPKTSLMFTHSSLIKDGDDYLWNLRLPIFSYCSWANLNKTPQNITTEEVNEIYQTRIYPNVLNTVPLNQTPPANEIPKTMGEVKLPESFENGNKQIQKYEYTYGFPSIPLGVMRSAIGSIDYNQYANKFLINAVCLVESSKQPVDITDEMVIDYNSTFTASKNFIATLPDDIKNQINNRGNSNPEDGGKLLCSYFCGFEIKNGVKYLTFIHPTISKNKLKPSLETGDDFNEWENNVNNIRNINASKEANALCPLTLVLRVPETPVGEQNGTSINHTEGKLYLMVNVDRAPKNFAGWARRIDPNNDKSVLACSLMCGREFTKSTSISNNVPFNASNNHIVQSRNENILIIANGINKNEGVKALIDEKNNKYGGDDGQESLVPIRDFLNQNVKIHKFSNIDNITKNTFMLYCKQNNDTFTIYRTDNFDPGKVNESDINYVVDIPLLAKLEFLTDGNEWFKGYTPKTSERLSLDVTIYNRENNGIQFIGRSPSNMNDPYKLGNDETNNWTQDLAQAFSATSTNLGELEGGYYINLSQITTLKTLKSNLDNWSMCLFHENYSNESTSRYIIGLTHNVQGAANDILVEQIYGSDWQKYVKYSITAGFKGIGDNDKFPSRFDEILDKIVPDSNTISQYIRKDLGRDTWSLTTDYGYNLMYDGTDTTPINEYFKITNGTIIEFTDKLKDIIKSKTEGFIFGMNIAVMFPMTHIYRGKYFVLRMTMTVNSDK